MDIRLSAALSMYGVRYMRNDRCMCIHRGHLNARCIYWGAHKGDTFTQSAVYRQQRRIEAISRLASRDANDLRTSRQGYILVDKGPGTYPSAKRACDAATETKTQAGLDVLSLSAYRFFFFFFFLRFKSLSFAMKFLRDSGTVGNKGKI